MTIEPSNPQTPKDKALGLQPAKSDAAPDARLVELVRMLARGAAERDYALLLQAKAQARNPDERPRR